MKTISAWCLLVERVCKISFLLVLLCLLLAACAQTQPAAYPGKLLLLYRPRFSPSGPNHFDTDPHLPGVYEMREGFADPQIIWGDLPINLEILSSLSYPSTSPTDYPVISPDGNLVLIIDQYKYNTAYLLDLRTGKGNLFPILCRECRILFSPDNRYLAYVSDGSDGVYLIDMKTVNLDELEKIILEQGRYEGRDALLQQAQLLVRGKCMFDECLALHSPFWLDSQTLLVFHDSDIYNPDYVMSHDQPDYYTVDQYGLAMTGSGIVGFPDTLSAIQVTDGKIVSSQPTPANLFFYPAFPAGNSYLANPTGVGDPYWLDTESLIRSGTLITHPLAAHNVYSISPDNTTLVRFAGQWEAVDLASGETTRLQKKPTSIQGVTSCVWAPDNQYVACIGEAWTEKSHQFQLFLVPLSGEPIMILRSWGKTVFDYNGWVLLAWQP